MGSCADGDIKSVDEFDRSMSSRRTANHFRTIKAYRDSVQTNSNIELRDVIIIGAGVCGIYMLHRMVEMGIDATVLEKSDSFGGTWNHNRYPGCRFDSESYTYGYSFDKELLETWNWSEHFAGQPEILSYLRYVVEKHDLEKHMQFESEVVSATWDDREHLWTLKLQNGRRLVSRFVFTAIGLLSIPTSPRFEGMDEFEGVAFHTYDWPREPLDLEGKKVAVIGTGASGVQVISDIADKVDTLTVFQRRPNWCAPLKNAPITDEDQAKIKASYDEILERCRKSPTGFLHRPPSQKFDEASPRERRVFWEEVYNAPGFSKLLGNYVKILTDLEANAEFSEFVADKIRERVDDPEVADKLIPKDHGFGSRRVPLETNYYETYNRDNVSLVDLTETPIERITSRGIRTSGAEYEFDIIVYATGFDAVTGAFDRMDIKGVDGLRLSEKWSDGPITYLGLQTTGFPNLVFLVGPQGASTSTNFPRAIEEYVDWATTLIDYLKNNNLTRIEASPEAEAAWFEHVKKFFSESLLSTTRSWFTGYNSNVAGHSADKLRYYIYTGGMRRYRERLADVAENDYKGFILE